MTMTEAAALALLKEEGLPTEGVKLRPLLGGFAALVKGPEPELAVLTQGQQPFDKLWAGGGSSKKKGLRRLPLNSNNAALVRRYVPGCSPKALGPEGTALGFTDLLGCDLSPAAALLAAEKDLQPFWVDVKRRLGHYPHRRRRQSHLGRSCRRRRKKLRGRRRSG